MEVDDTTAPLITCPPSPWVDFDTPFRPSPQSFSGAFECFETVPPKWRKSRIGIDGAKNVLGSGTFGCVSILVPQRLHRERALSISSITTMDTADTVDVRTWHDDPQDVMMVRGRHMLVSSTEDNKEDDGIDMGLPAVAMMTPTHRRVSNQPLVCKQCNPRTLGDGFGVPAEMVREIAILWQLAHIDSTTTPLAPIPHGVVLPTNRRHVVPRLVMDLGGQSLLTLLTVKSPQKRITDEECRTIAFQLLCLTHRMWCEFRIVHLDLKPANIVVNNFRHPRHPMQVRLIDWGASYSRDRLKTDVIRNHVTTMWYEAPEAVMGSDQGGIAQDKWSLGAVLLILALRGKVRFGGGSYIEQFWMQCRYFGRPSTTTGWCSRNKAAVAALNTMPQWHQAHPQRTRDFHTLEALWPGFGELVFSGLLCMHPSHRWTCEQLAASLQQPLQRPPKTWRRLPNRSRTAVTPVASIRLRSLRTLFVARGAAAHKGTLLVQSSEIRATLLQNLLPRIGPMGIDHPLAPWMLIEVLDAAIGRLLPGGWQQPGLIIFNPSNTWWTLSKDAILLCAAVWWVVFKWLSDTAPITAADVASMFDINVRRECYLVQMESKLLRACPDLLGLEASAIRAFKATRFFTASPNGTVVLLATALQLHAQIHAPALWRLHVTRQAVLTDIRSTMRHIAASDGLSTQEVPQPPWLLKNHSVPIEWDWCGTAFTHATVDGRRLARHLFNQFVES